MDNSLQKRVTLLSLLKYTFPTVVMMVFFSFYTIVDGMFIAKFVGSNALSATNIVFPVINIIIGVKNGRSQNNRDKTEHIRRQRQGCGASAFVSS